MNSSRPYEIFRNIWAFSFIFFLLSGHSLIAQPEFHDLNIHIVNIRDPRGQIILDLYDDPQSYAAEIPLKRYYFSKNKMEDAKMSCSIYIPEGSYALVLIDDVNMDDKINRNLFGYPLEGFGFTNVDKFPLGKPDFDRIKFIFSCKDPHIQLLIMY
jgi:uncharacterized protein (DUF2141 family)